MLISTIATVATVLDTFALFERKRPAFFLSKTSQPSNAEWQWIPIGHKCQWLDLKRRCNLTVQWSVNSSHAAAVAMKMIIHQAVIRIIEDYLINNECIWKMIFYGKFTIQWRTRCRVMLPIRPIWSMDYRMLRDQLFIGYASFVFSALPLPSLRHILSRSSIGVSSILKTIILAFLMESRRLKLLFVWWREKEMKSNSSFIFCCVHIKPVLRHFTLHSLWLSMTAHAHARSSEKRVSIWQEFITLSLVLHDDAKVILSL